MCFWKQLTINYSKDHVSMKYFSALKGKKFTASRKKYYGYTEKNTI